MSTVGMFFLGRELFKNKWIGFLSAALYVVFPFSLVYDRMALYDSMVGTFAIWSLYLEVLLVRKLRWDLAFLTALVVGGGIRTKKNIVFNIYFLPFLLVLFDWSKEKRTQRLLRFIGCSVIVIVLSYAYYSILRLSPYFGIIGEKNYTFIYPPSYFFHHPFDFVVGNTKGLFNWFITYTNWLGFLLAIASFFVMRKYWREKIILAIWFGVAFTALAFDGKVLYPRYILPMTIFLLPLMSVSLFEALVKFRNKSFGIVLVIALFLSYLYVDRFILFDFAHAPIADSDLGQYINAWPAGGGVTEMITYFRLLSANQKIYVASEGTFGSVPTLGMQIYLDKDANIQKRGIYPIPQHIPNDLVQKAKVMPTFMVFEQTQTPPAGWPLRLITKYQKGVGNWYMSIYQITPSQKS